MRIATFLKFVVPVFNLALFSEKAVVFAIPVRVVRSPNTGRYIQILFIIGPRVWWSQPAGPKQNDYNYNVYEYSSVVYFDVCSRSSIVCNGRSANGILDCGRGL